MDKQYKLHIYLKWLKKLHVITYEWEYINILNPCNFFLSKLEEVKSCMYCIKAGYTWVRL